LRSMNPFQQIYLEAARQTGFKLIDDFNGADQEGIGIYQVMQKNGERWNAARAYLAPASGQPPQPDGHHPGAGAPHPVHGQARQRRRVPAGRRSADLPGQT
jgi:choline dehydrogenase-like flavoprotein